MADADTTAPVLTSFSLPSKVDLSHGSAAVTATVSAADVGLGVDHVYVSLDRPVQGTSGLLYGFSLGYTDTFADGVSSLSTLFTTQTASGMYGINNISIYDKAGNYKIYYTADLLRLGFQTSFEVTNTNTVNNSGPFSEPHLVFQAFGASPGAGSWSTDDHYPRELADVNGDGRADVVGFGEAGVYVALANASGGFDPAQLKLQAFGASPGAGSWTSDDRYHRELADVNGDGRADIVGFGEAGVYVSYSHDLLIV
jgi:hypothetical protein